MIVVRHKASKNIRCTFSAREDAEAQVELFIETEGAAIGTYVIEEVEDEPVSQGEGEAQ